MTELILHLYSLRSRHMMEVRTRSLFGRAGKAVIVGSHFEIAPCDSVCTGRKMWGIYPLAVQQLFESAPLPCDSVLRPGSGES